MPSAIKLLDLVAIPHTRHLWPNEFEGLIKTWEETRNNDQLGIIADWLDDHDEPELAHVFRWCHRRNVQIWETGYPAEFYIEVKSLAFKSYRERIVGQPRTGVCGMMADLASVIAEIREVIA